MRSILHIDMDAFFASVEIRDRPELRGLPVVVGGAGRRGVVAAASYPARRYGVHSAMPMARALSLCPKLVVIAGRHGHYAAVSQQVFDIFRDVTPLVEGLSLDEAFLDVTHSRSLFGDGRTIAERIRARIQQEVGLTASAGVAICKFVAKIASDMNKPDGLTVTPEDPHELAQFLAPMPIERMWGVGAKSAPRFHAFGLHTFGDLARADATWLARALGESTLSLQALARGEDPRPVEAERPPKSIGSESTFEEDRVGGEATWRAVLVHAERVAARLHARNLAARTVTLKLREPEFRTHTLRATLPEAVADLDSLAAAAKELLARFSARGGEASLRFRLIGLSASGLTHQHTQGRLFDDPTRARREKLQATVAQVQQKSGARLSRASLLGEPRRD